MIFLALLLQLGTPGASPPAVANTTFPTPAERLVLLSAFMAGLGVLAKHYWDQFLLARKDKKEERRKVTDLLYLSNKVIELNRYAQLMLDTVACDHVSIYAASNGEFLTSGDSIKKFNMQAEAAPQGEPRYMDLEPLLMANTIPHLVAQLYTAPYVLMWPGQCDDERANQIMRRRNYRSSIAMLVFFQTPEGRCPLGMVVLNWKQITLHPIRSQLPPTHGPFETYVTAKLQQALLRFRIEVADLLDNKQ